MQPLKAQLIICRSFHSLRALLWALLTSGMNQLIVVRKVSASQPEQIKPQSPRKCTGLSCNYYVDYCAFDQSAGFNDMYLHNEA